MWHRITVKDIPKMKPKRIKPCVARSTARPNRAYVMLPMTMASHWSANVYHDGGSRIALEFEVGGDLVVRQTSPTASTVRINLPCTMAELIPFGLHSVDYTLDPEGKVILDLQTAEYATKKASNSSAVRP